MCLILCLLLCNGYSCTEEKVQEIMTADERQKLYDAIGYEENVTSDLPKEVCCLLYYEIKTVYVTVGYQYIMVFCVVIFCRWISDI